MPHSSPIFIVGFPGCGKTTFGRALAKALGRGFIDLDKYIEARFMRSIATLFAERGEEGFRKVERNMLQEVAAMEDVVVACGGGTPCFFDNMATMLQSGVAVWLRTTEECLFRRLILKRDKRPLIAGKSDDQIKEYIAEALGQRAPFYSQAQIEFEGDELENRREIDSTVSRFLKLHGSIFPPAEH